MFCANCGKPAKEKIFHTNIVYGTHYFCCPVCKLNWIYEQFKTHKLRRALDQAMELVQK
ncbi:MAG: hypothetical protein MUO31_00875 [Thermodesulfovibrionales bacterium]|nr:hypothetical protein [Thermodesulfovibrionales bacterium]